MVCRAKEPFLSPVIWFYYCETKYFPLAISVFSSVSPPEAYVDFSMATEWRIKNSRMTVEWQMVGLNLFFWVSSGRRCEGPCFHSKASVLLWSLSWHGLKARWHFYGCICREKQPQKWRGWFRISPGLAKETNFICLFERDCWRNIFICFC